MWILKSTPLTSMKSRPENEPRSRPTSRLPSTLTLDFCVAQYVSRALECQVRLSVSDAIPASQCGKVYLRLAVSM